MYLMFHVKHQYSFYLNFSMYVYLKMFITIILFKKAFIIKSMAFDFPFIHNIDDAWQFYEKQCTTIL